MLKIQCTWAWEVRSNTVFAFSIIVAWIVRAGIRLNFNHNNIITIYTPHPPPSHRYTHWSSLHLRVHTCTHTHTPLHMQFSITDITSYSGLITNKFWQLKSSTPVIASRRLYSITLHPLKDPELMYRVHQYFQELNVKQLMQEVSLVQDHLQRLIPSVPDKKSLLDHCHMNNIKGKQIYFPTLFSF